MSNVAAIVMAAGSSTRMGSPKPLLDWGGRTLVEYQVTEMRAAGIERVIVVLGSHADEIRPLIEKSGADPLVNEDYKNGRASSLRLAANALPDDTRTILVLNVDQPRPHTVTEALLRAHEAGGNLITVPSFSGRRGHPVALAGWLLPDLRQVQQVTKGLQGLLRKYDSDVAETPIASEVVLLDINTPEEYEAAIKTHLRAEAPISP